jgi:hypothetical protein
MLQSICNNTPYVQYLYVYQIRQDGCHVVFDFETNADELDRYDEIPEVSTDGIGETVEFEESFYDLIPTLLEGALPVGRAVKAAVLHAYAAQAV